MPHGITTYKMKTIKAKGTGFDFCHWIPLLQADKTCIFTLKQNNNNNNNKKYTLLMQSYMAQSNSFPIDSELKLFAHDGYLLTASH